MINDLERETRIQEVRVESRTRVGKKELVARDEKQEQGTRVESKRLVAREGKQVFHREKRYL